MKVSEYMILLMCLLCVFITLFIINTYYLEGIPHVPDEAAYLFMAKVFASGHVVLPIPASPLHFNFFPGILSVDGGLWLFQYPFGHPLILSLGILFGNVNVIPALIGTMVVMFIFLIALKIYDRKTALIVLLLPLLSPFFLENAASFMSHNTASFYLVAAFFFLILFYRNLRKEYILLMLTGILLGLMFNTRPLTALPFILVIGIILLFKRTVGGRLKPIVVFLISLCSLLVLWFLYNRSITGNLMQSQYYLMNKGLFAFSIDSRLLRDQFENVNILFHNLSPMLFNWPVSITYLFLFIPFILKKNNFWDNIFLAMLPLLPIMYFFYNGTFLMYGPRFWYEMLPFIFLLTARGIGLLFTVNNKIAFFVFSLLIFTSIARFFSFLSVEDPDPMSPLSLRGLKTFNSVDSRLIRIVKDSNIHNAVVFVDGCTFDWWCYGSVFSQNSPFLDTDVVYARDLGDQVNRKLEESFKDRQYYRINYNTLQLGRI